MHQEWATACRTCDSSGPLERSYFQNHVATETGHDWDHEEHKKKKKKAPSTQAKYDDY